MTRMNLFKHGILEPKFFYSNSWYLLEIITYQVYWLSCFDVHVWIVVGAYESGDILSRWILIKKLFLSIFDEKTPNLLHRSQLYITLLILYHHRLYFCFTICSAMSTSLPTSKISEVWCNLFQPIGGNFMKESKVIS